MSTPMYTFITVNKESSNQLRTRLRKDLLQGFSSKFMNNHIQHILCVSYKLFFQHLFE